MTIEISGFDPTLWKRLLLEAKHRGLSTNQLMSEAILHFLEIGNSVSQKRPVSTISSLAGTWTDEEVNEFEKNTEDFGKIDNQIW